MYETWSAEYIRIYESIVIEFFRWLKIHKIDTSVQKFDIEKRHFVVSMVNNETLTLAMQFH